jgi:histidinol-phosphate phosphatase family protein
MHQKMEMLLGDHHAFVDRIYYCPHHPDKGFAGERPELKIPCDCRKPAIGMVERGRQALHIDPAQSWLIGDSTTDMQTARNAGLRSILVGTGHGGQDGKYDATPDFTCENLLDAVHLLLKNSTL